MSSAAAVFSRQNPSPRYRQLVAMYNEMHVQGEKARNRPPEKVFPGESLPVHAIPIKDLIDKHGAKSLLDYGAGKGMQYKWTDLKLSDGRVVPDLKSFWGVDSIRCYDPAYPPFIEVPAGQFDGVICTDVLEHCPEPDIPWILDELFGYARKFVYGNIACHLAKSILPNGENAHTTAKPEEWWKPRIAAAAAKRPDVRYRFVLENKKRPWWWYKRIRFRSIVEG